MRSTYKTRSLQPRYARLVLLGSLAMLLAGPGCGGPQNNIGPVSSPGNPAELQPDIHNGAANAGWKYDAYPNAQSLDAHKTMTVADLKGPAQINVIHVTQMYKQPFQKEPFYDTARDVVLQIFFDGTKKPAVSVPLGYFFADGNGKAADFSTHFVEKAPGSYNCYIPMPFQKSAHVTLINNTDHDLFNYTVVEWQSLPRWNDGLGYFHASWQDLSFQLTPDTRQHFYHLQGPGKLIGKYWMIQTKEPLFAGMTFVMEGNNEYRIDGEQEPSINYLGSEDSFNFSWGWHALFDGYKIGINYLDKKPGESVVSAYRFRDRDAIHFRKSLDLTVDWTHEFKRIPQLQGFLKKVRERNAKGGGQVNYAVTTYWYSSNPQE